MRRFAGTAAVLLAACAGTAALASPAAADSNAPYARGAAIINADGTLRSGKHVAQTRRLDTGRYCVTFDNTIEREGAIAVTQTHDWRRLNLYLPGASGCDGPHDFKIGSDDPRTGEWKDGVFTLAVL
ncbi:hypothetical protein ABZW32_09160 [Streptomyces sp. NPDC004667]|uniref:hypothetical protein n=1 Tax=Streptomyces sp. NPDC004667 TaxID=3154285 RepID=UPI0033B56EBA